MARLLVIVFVTGVIVQSTRDFPDGESPRRGRDLVRVFIRLRSRERYPRPRIWNKSQVEDEGFLGLELASSSQAASGTVISLAFGIDWTDIEE